MNFKYIVLAVSPDTLAGYIIGWSLLSHSLLRTRSSVKLAPAHFRIPNHQIRRVRQLSSTTAIDFEWRDASLKTQVMHASIISPRYDYVFQAREASRYGLLRNLPKRSSNRAVQKQASSHARLRKEVRGFHLIWSLFVPGFFPGLTSNLVAHCLPSLSWLLLSP
jgi:hypothetical protein